MKLKGIWIAICLIIVAGVCATSYTRQYTSETAEMRSLEAAKGVPETAAESAFEFGAAPAAEAEVQAAPAKDGMAADGPAAVTGAMAEAAAAEDAELSAVMQELTDLDAQIERSHTGTVDTTANSLKASAESEWKLWEAKMERFLDILEEKLPPEEKEKLFLEQTEWTRDRESTAAAASKKQNGSALVELEYNLSMKEITRERVYELARRFEKELAEE